MIQKVLVTPIIGLPQINGWAQVTESSQGRFVCSFSIAGLQAGNVGRDLVDIIKSSAPDNANTAYSLIKKIVRFVEEKDCQVQLVCGLFDGNQSVFAAFDGGLILKRDDRVGRILFADQEIKIIEGQHTTGDIFVLMTKQALEFKEEIIQKLAQGLDADTIVASTVPGVQNSNNSSLVAMSFISDLPEGERVLFSEKPMVEFDQSDLSEESEIFPEAEIINNLSKENFADQADFLSQAKEPVSFNKKINLDQDQFSKVAKSASHSALDFLRRFFKFVIFLFKESVIFFRRLVSKEVYVEGSDQRGNLIKKNLKYILGGGIGLILIIIPFLVFRFRVNAQIAAAKDSIAVYVEQYQNAQILVEESPLEAREIVIGVIDKLKAKEKSFEGQKSAQKIISQQLAEVEEYYSSISGKEEFQELDVFFDFVLVESDFVASRAYLVGETAFFFDKDTKEVVKLELSSKKSEKLSLVEIEEISDLGFNEAEVYVLESGVSKKKLGADAQLSQIIDEGKANRGAKFLEIFNNNLYILSIEQRNVFKYGYLAQEEKYAEPIRWIQSAKDLDFNEVSSMVVDGDIWLTTKQGYIFKLTQGVSQDFEVKGLSDPFSSSIILFTTEDSENLYILEAAKSRLVVLSKSGEFIKEIKSISLASANDILVSKEKNKALIVSGSLVFEVGL